MDINARLLAEEDVSDFIRRVSMEDLELIVAAANIAGHLEAAGKIYIDSDTDLAEHIAWMIRDYYIACKNSEPAFPEFAQDHLINRFYAA